MDGRGGYGYGSWIMDGETDGEVYRWTVKEEEDIPKVLVKEF